MNPSFRRVLAKGFTLIELLIVVIIIAILAAIAIPQFSNTSSDAQEAALDANLNTMRSAIELYRLQHNNRYPGAVATSGGTNCPAGDAGTSAATDAASQAIAFTQALTMYSNAAGQTCKTNPAGGAFVYGPYLRAVPGEPVTPSTTVAIVNDAANAIPTATTGGWRFNITTGQLVMNSTNVARDQRKYYEH
ncbi:prepilin-type N-terminal cleavage/methylation domain-containing protein [Massilia sp. G4R7]|uniref:Prepilin-type N-terminal cleavage/methylation domain-containing protein n=1 Tax=Massilia phyllostachyos TaxID=2898585 RepID=A0ABS8QBL7_9BURK|nr:prepilin-type N-terminal cleavage/methylation domain-containing protein [Massilia phyllostachyos]MCD2519152.1 prepilin-type N-terminal cleavage/methylation domain-containing protein [Massilia phyllostachyos]